MPYHNLPGTFTNSLITLVLATTFLIVGGRRLHSAVMVAVMQAVLLAGITAILGFHTGNHEIFAAVVLTLVVKAGIIPFILIKVINKIGPNREINSYINIKISLLISAFLVFVAYASAGKLIGPGTGSLTNALPAALAMILIGFFVMITRKLAIMQIIGLLVMENGLYLAGVGTTNGIPLVVELGVFLDILAGVLIMGILTFRINRSFDSINTEELKNLRG